MTVNIEGVGVVRVRRLGAGEELDLSDKMRRLGAIINQLSKIDFRGLDSANSEDAKKISKLSKKAELLSSEITEIKRFELKAYKKCFSDDANGKVVDILMDTLTDEERIELFKRIFNPKIVEAPEGVDLMSEEDDDDERS